VVLGLCSFVVRAVILISFLRGINPLVFGNIKWIHACLCSQPICMTYLLVQIVRQPPSAVSCYSRPGLLQRVRQGCCGSDPA